MHTTDELRVVGVMEQGYGLSPKSVMRDPRLSIEAKAIYAYISSYAGSGSTAFPSKSRIAADLRISEERLYTHRKQLIQCGYISVTQERGGGGRMGKTIYTLNPVAIAATPDSDAPCAENPSADIPCAEKPCAENQSHNNNRSNNNRSNNNRSNNNRSNNNSKTAAVVDAYHEICVSFSRVLKTTEKRARLIRTLLQEFSLDEIKEAFTIAEGNDFLKGHNERRWKATFDWMMNPTNLAKILEGNYAEIRGSGKRTEPATGMDAVRANIDYNKEAEEWNW